MSAPLLVAVLCRSLTTVGDWQARRRHYPGLRLVPVPLSGEESACGLVNQLLSDEPLHGLEFWCDAGVGADAVSPRDDLVLICHDDIWFGLDFATDVAVLAERLERDCPNWGVCGNTGVLWDGRIAGHHALDALGGPQPGCGMQPVLLADGALLLLNRAALRAEGIRLPALPGDRGHDLLLGLECLRHGRLSLVDPALMAQHLPGPGGDHDLARVVMLPAFQDWYRQHFLNHRLPSVEGLLALDAAVDYGYLALPQPVSGRADVVELFDRALARLRAPRRPRLTIACRTQLNRQELLLRALTSFAVAASEAGDLLEFRVRIISSRPADELAAAVAGLRARVPGLELDGWAFPVRDGRYSRMDVLLQAVERADDEGDDTLWCVDDDDYILPGALRPIARALRPGQPVLVIGRSDHSHEVWSQDADGSCRLLDAQPGHAYPAEGVFRALLGSNHTPVCSMLFPVPQLRQRSVGLAARGDYNEDYFLLLLTLTTPGLEVALVPETLCRISIRPQDNTVTMTDRSMWHLSYTTFMSEVLRYGNQPFLWQMASRQSVGGAGGGGGAAAHPPFVWRCIRLAYLLRAIGRATADPRRIFALAGRFIHLTRARGWREAMVTVLRFGEQR